MGFYPDEYVGYLLHFHATRDFFECHELLEEYWKEHPDDGLSLQWIGLIGVAVGQYHERRGNRQGAAKCYRQAMNRLERAEMAVLGLDGAQLHRQLTVRAAAAEEGHPYEDLMLPISDEELLERCLQSCREQNLEWGSASAMDNEALIHRHKLRDRSEVIAARAESLELKRQSRSAGNS